MITVFERIPDVFVQIYDAQFQTWAREFRVRGGRCAIVFRPVPGRGVLLDADGRPIMAGAWLSADIDRSGPGEARIVVRPASDQDEEIIARHVREMAPHVLQ